jgi:hypothetical protein
MLLSESLRRIEEQCGLPYEVIASTTSEVER